MMAAMALLRSSLRPLQTFCIIIAASAIATGGCVARGRLEGRASDQWTRRYTVAAGGEFQIVGGNGTIEVEASSGPEIDVDAERVGHASTDAAAAEIASRIRVNEDVSPDRVVLREDGLGGVIVGVETEVNFHVRVPAGLKVRLHTSNGRITVSGVEGNIVASTTNGAFSGKRLTGGVEVRGTNGNVNVDLARVTTAPVELRTTNGVIVLALPQDANANVDASVTNGSIDIQNLPLERSGEQTNRRVRGRLNQGGTPIQLTTVNGSVRLSASTAPGTAQ